MRGIITTGLAVAAAIAAPGAAFAAPSNDPIKAAVVNDCGKNSINGDCTTLDMIGTFAGVVKYRHLTNKRAFGDLRLVFNIKDAPKHSEYRLEIYCGPTALQSGALIAGLDRAVKTDGKGASSAGPFEVPAADITKACGSGRILGHLQLVDLGGGSILDAAPIDLTIPKN